MSTNQSGSIIGLTGGIATGKSTVARMLADRGVEVVDADELSRVVVQPGRPAHDEIVEAFGDQVLTEEGRIDRSRLADEVFRDDQARQTLEAITHPRIAEEMLDRARRAFEQGHDWIVYEAALLVETETHRMLDATIVVDCSPDTQLKRLQQRDELDEDQARRRIDAQMPLEDKRRVAEFVVDNDGSLQQTRRQVDELKDRIDELIDTHGTANPDDPTHG